MHTFSLKEQVLIFVDLVNIYLLLLIIWKKSGIRAISKLLVNMFWLEEKSCIVVSNYCI